MKFELTEMQVHSLEVALMNAQTHALTDEKQNCLAAIRHCKAILSQVYQTHTPVEVVDLTKGNPVWDVVDSINPKSIGK